MILDTPTKSLRIVLGEAKGTLDCDIVSCWGGQTSTGFQPAANDLVSNGTTAVTVVSAPGAGEQRQVNEVRLFNNDTITHNVTLQFDNGGTIRVVEAAAVNAGDEFLYTPSSTNRSIAGAGNEWNAGAVDFISNNLTIRAGATLDLANSISIVGTVTAAAASISGLAQAGTLASAGNATVTLLLSGGTIQVGSSTPFSSFSTHFAVSSGTLDLDNTWNAGSVSAIDATQLVINGTTLGIRVSPTIQVDASTINPMIVSSNASTAFPVLTGVDNLVIIGHDNSGSGTEIIAVSGTAGAGSGGAQAIYGRMRGSLASPSALLNGDVVFSQFIRGYDGTSYATARGLWSAAAASNWTGSSHENYQTWSNIANGATISTEVMRLTSAGALLIGTAAATGSEKLKVAGQTITQELTRSDLTATAGNVGEYISQSIASGSAVTLTSGSVAAIGSIVISGTGDFDLYGMIALTGTTTTTVTTAQTSINTTGTVLGTTLGLFSNNNFGGVALGGEDLSMNIIGARVTAAGTYFLNTKVTFAVGTLNAYGLIEARRR